MNALITDGIDGDYALANKQGLFGGMIKLKIKLNRFPSP